ncbi:glycosyltransferase [Streptomyces sp. NPDC059629]|uniref:UDP-N-acetylglucosamine--N-acetylmuramyl- (pentapeptide) pyrophosphoryl-undecaprenol N-acetylglucosamine transferase n=1 Tax=Streptomyces sp. NPDC059629 TaxID=3346889 RepID=UPI003691DFB0
MVTGGGTGGHVYPALTTVREARRIVGEDRAGPDRPELDVVWVGTATGLEARVAAAEEGVRFRALSTGKIRRTRSLRSLWLNLVDLFKIPLGVAQALRYVMTERPHVVFSVGGYVCVPVAVAAWLTRRRLVMHEQTLNLGLANRLVARLADVIALSHASSIDSLPPRLARRAVVTGNPIRPGLLHGNREAALRRYGFQDEPLVYVTGGSQGSAQINELVTAVLPELLKHCQVVHQCGSAAEPVTRQRTASLPDDLRRRYVLLDYVGDTEMADLLAAADVVISRSGAGTLAELTAAGRVTVLVPLVPTSGDEQRRNAQRVVEAGAGRMLAGADATSENLWAHLTELLGDPALRTAMALRSRSLGQPDAARTVAGLLLDQAHRAASA